MRKVSYCAFLAAMVLFLALSLPVYATDDAVNHIGAITSSLMEQGTDGTCYVHIDSLERISTLIVTVYFDPGKIQVTDGHVYNVAPSLLYDKSVKSDSVQFSYIFDGSAGAARTILFNFEYSVLADAEIGATYFDVVVSEAYDSSLAAVAVAGSRCDITILYNPNVVVHNYTRQVIAEAYQKSAATCTAPAVYYYCCDSCDQAGTDTFEYGAALGHTGGAATCTEQAVCSRCSQAYGGILEHDFTDCEAELEYRKTKATCTQPAVYYKNCVMCGMAGESTFEYGAALGHVGGMATCTAQAQCVLCNQLYGDVLAHTYENELAQDEYLAANATCTARAEYYKSCVCGAAGTEVFEYGNMLEHRYDNSCDTDCADCGFIREVTHTYYAELSKDSGKHWYECSACGSKKDEGDHLPGAAATETTAQLCTVCGYEIAPALGHTHKYDSIKCDESDHWSECACGDRTSAAAHTWDDGTVTKQATYESAGEITYTCLICASKKIESIDKLVMPEQDKSDDKTTDVSTGENTDVVTDKTDDNDTKINDDNTAVRIIAAVSAVLVIGIAAVLVIRFKFHKGR